MVNYTCQLYFSSLPGIKASGACPQRLASNGNCVLGPPARKTAYRIEFLSRSVYEIGRWRLPPPLHITAEPHTVHLEAAYALVCIQSSL
jgi:hypothetical protein